MNTSAFDYRNNSELEHWVRQVYAGTTDVVAIRDADTVVAEIRAPRTTLPTPPGWLAAGHTYNDDELPAPFDTLRFNSRNIGASVWIHLASGAKIAAVPTGPWDEKAGFAFYYADRDAQVPLPLPGWTNAQREWDGSESQYTSCHREAIGFFNSALSGTQGAAAPWHP